MKESAEITGYGACALRSWDDLRRSGGPSPSPEQINKYLNKPKRERLTREELKQRIQAFFDDLIEEYQDQDTGQMGYAWRSCPTKSGLAMKIGISSFTLSRYLRNANCKGEAYNDREWGNRAIVSPNDFDLIEQAITVVESFYEASLGKNQNNSGCIFWLKNRTNVQWHDEQDINLTASREDDVPHMTREEIACRYREFQKEPEPLVIDD